MIPLFLMLALSSLADGGADSGVEQATSAEPEAKPAHAPRLERSTDPSEIRVRNVRLVLERDGDSMKASEVVTLAAPPGKSLSAPGGVLIPLPSGATAPVLDGSMESLEGISVSREGIRVDSEIPPGSLEVAFTFRIPIKDGAARVLQEFPVTVDVARIACTWTYGGTRLQAKRMLEATKTELSTGVIGLLTVGPLGTRTLDVRLTDMGSPPGQVRHPLVLVLCVLILLAGIGVRLFLRRRNGR